MDIAISVKDLRKKFHGKDVFSNISFDIEKGDFVAFFGPNGCGKSTIFNILSNIVEKDSGSCSINLSNISYIFQNYRDSLFPWRKNHENLVFPLELKRKSKEEIKKDVNVISRFFHIKLDLEKYPYQLSGGQQQVLAFYRGIVNKSDIILLDEPFSALDYENGLILRKCLQDYYLSYKPTIAVITHDIEEAVQLANKIIVLSRSPTKIVDVIDNSQNYPRDISFLESDAFDKTRKKVLDAFQKGAGL